MERGSRKERKVVTVLFCDLVGFTSQAETMDPEDVEALLGPYHERLRSELERRGGTVEKFIGDAVMALFGAPVAHEDDPERAVRACLAIRDWAIEQDDAQVRIAVTTGEALIRLDARPEAGEGMASGDVVNTAARLQSAAPVNGILADETTYRATRQVVDYREAPAVEAKGKAEPIAVWEVVAAHSRFGVDVAHEARTELVGRERELSLLRDAFDRARHERTPQLVTLVGVPGMGKSRLVYELSQIGEADPELLERRPGWGGGKLNATTLALAPLSEEQTAVLIAHLLERPVLPAESQQVLLERAGGNPLYAEQFAELYLERGSAEELSLPETLQGIIAARLDGLAQSEKELLRDAAVVGKVFWASALASGGESAEAALHSLERKGFVRRQKRSSVDGETELAFAHALVRDVAYGQIARADRVEKHRHVAEWVESLGRPDDHAEMLAHHWSAALEFARAAGQDGGELADRTRLALRDAGDRAFALNAFAPADAYYTEAIELWPLDASGRAGLLFRRAHALHVMGDERQIPALEEARDALLAVGDTEPAAEAEAFLSRAAWYRGRGDDARRHLERAQELVADAGPTVAKARVLCLSARLNMLSSEEEEAIRIGAQALALAEELELDELRIHALTSVGTAKAWLDHTGRAELDLALEIAKATNSPLAVNVLNNLGVLANQDGDVVRAEEFNRETLHMAQRMGDGENIRFSRANLLFSSMFRGRWDETLENADRFIAECETSPHNMEAAAREMRAHVRLARGDVDAALDDGKRALELARELKDPTRVLPALLGRARGLAWVGRVDEARPLVAAALEIARAKPTIGQLVGVISGEARMLGVAAEVVEVLSMAPDGPWKEAALAEAGGEPVRAAESYERMGAPALEADARFGAAHALLEDGRTVEGLAELDKALAFYRSVNATFFLERGEALLAEAQRDSA